MGKTLNKIGGGNSGKKMRTVGVKKLLPQEIQDQIQENKLTTAQRAAWLGVNGNNYPNPSPTYLPIKRAKVIKKYDSYITLGGDAPQGPGSGYSSLGGRCSSIDLVTGRLSSVIDASTDPKLYALDNFDLDAARIYICQRTDVDDNFGFVDGNVGNSKARSAIAAKADAIRIHGREGIKLITSAPGDANSAGGEINTIYGIDLIAGNNDSDLQPIPKGDHLVKVLEETIYHIGILYSTVFSISQAMNSFSISLASHTHIGNIGAPTAPSIELIPAALKLGKTIVQDGLLSSMQERLNSAILELNTLYSLGSDYINSDLNRTN
jgi:hypothetical protein